MRNSRFRSCPLGLTSRSSSGLCLRESLGCILPLIGLLLSSDIILFFPIILLNHIDIYLASLTGCFMLLLNATFFPLRHFLNQRKPTIPYRIHGRLNILILFVYLLSLNLSTIFLSGSRPRPHLTILFSISCDCMVLFGPARSKIDKLLLPLSIIFRLGLLFCFLGLFGK